MLRYLIRRLVALVPTFLLASVIVFSAIRLIPGNTIDMMMSQNDISASVQTLVRATRSTASSSLSTRNETMPPKARICRLARACCL